MKQLFGIVVGAAIGAGVAWQWNMRLGIAIAVVTLLYTLLQALERTSGDSLGLNGVIATTVLRMVLFLGLLIAALFLREWIVAGIVVVTFFIVSETSASSIPA